VRRYLARRLLQLVPVTLLITLLVFSMLLLLPGDPIRAIIGPGEALDAQQMEALRREHHLDRPILVQYGLWLSKVVRGDLGRSTQTRRRVADELRDRLPLTLQLGIASSLIAVLIAVPAGLVSALRRGSPLDVVVTAIATAGVALPGFWLGIMAILLFGVKLGWLPTHGYVSLFADPLGGLRHLVLPAFALGVNGAVLIMRQMRSSALEALSQDYIRTARAKGLAESRVLLVHALRNSLLPVVTVIGLQVGRIFAGAVVVEALFALPGMGRLIVDGVFQRDFPVVQAGVLLIAVAVLLANLLTDLLYAALDPRIRYS
jgi:peptide/nickel transport system permease protein